ncbi:terminase small subunit [Bacillus phage vB_BthS_BMBphi]|nr:terminase small subunit [Bacillus phage vB_BthS_BMBphi]
MSTLALALVIVILSVVSFVLGVNMALSGVARKVRELEHSSHHNGMKWIKLIEWMKS